MRLFIATLLLAISYAQTEFYIYANEHSDSACQSEPGFSSRTTYGIGCEDKSVASSGYIGSKKTECKAAGIIEYTSYSTSDCSGPPNTQYTQIFTWLDCNGPFIDVYESTTWDTWCLPLSEQSCENYDICCADGYECNHDIECVADDGSVGDLVACPQCLAAPTVDCPGDCLLSCTYRWNDYFQGCGDACNPQLICDKCPTPKEECDGYFEGDILCYPEAEDYPMPTTTMKPTMDPTTTMEPTMDPTTTMEPTMDPVMPTMDPTTTMTPTADPVMPTMDPTTTMNPTVDPTTTMTPTTDPTMAITEKPCEDDDDLAIAEALNRGHLIEGCSAAVDFNKGINLCQSRKWGFLTREVCPATCGLCPV